MKKESEKGSNAARMNGFCQLFCIQNDASLFVCVCVNPALIKTADWAALQREEFIKSIRAEDGRASLVFLCSSSSITSLFSLTSWLDIESKLKCNLKDEKR